MAWHSLGSNLVSSEVLTCPPLTTPSTSPAKNMLRAKPTDRKVAYVQLRKHLFQFVGWCAVVRLTPLVLSALQSKST